MSTRSVIARPWGDGFEGRYHHYDGYPSGVGAQLWELYHGRYAGDVGAMVAELIEAHPAGWSTINGADWSLEPGFVDRLNGPCAVCGLGPDGHYRQYLPHDDPRRAVPAGGSYLFADHAPVDIPDNRPQCYCHGARAEDEQMIRSTEDDGGTEWAYVLSPGGMLVCERRWGDDGSHMVGMVGMFGAGGGADQATWLPLNLFPWDGEEPDWSALECREVSA